MTSRTLSQALAVMRKELRDGVRDRRAVFSLLFGATVGPLLVGAILTFMAGRVRDAQDVSIPVVGGTHAPALVQWLRQQPGVTVTPGPGSSLSVPVDPGTFCVQLADTAGQIARVAAFRVTISAP